jgi:hypothetical protein
MTMVDRHAHHRLAFISLERGTMREPMSKTLHARIDALPMCQGARASLINEVDHAERFADDLLGATRRMQAFFERLRRVMRRRTSRDRPTQRGRQAV